MLVSPSHQLAGDPKWGKRKEAIEPQFQPSPRLELHGAKVTSNAGLFAYPELDEVEGLTKAAGVCLSD